MADLNIRNVPDDLRQKLKVTAAEMKMSLRDLCVLKLAQPIGFGSVVAAMVQRHQANNQTSIEETPAAETFRPKLPERPHHVAAAFGGCKLCGGLNGLHQKGCRAS